MLYVSSESGEQGFCSAQLHSPFLQFVKIAFKSNLEVHHAYSFSQPAVICSFFKQLMQTLNIK